MASWSLGYLVLVGVAFMPKGLFAFDQATYDKMFPLSVKSCALTQVNRLATGKGGSFGHAVVYLRGACLDKQYSYPQLRLCTREEMAHANTSGVGVSVNKVFKNVNWIGIPGHALFFHGNLEKSQALSQQNIDTLAEQIIQMGLFQNIEAKESFAARSASKAEALNDLIDESLDTDFALTWGRDLYCINFPVVAEQLARGIEFLNLLNMQFADPQRLTSTKPQALQKKILRELGVDFKGSDSGLENRWNGIVENCAHTSHNVLAAMGIDRAKKIRPGLFQQPFDLTSPADSWYELVKESSVLDRDGLSARTTALMDLAATCRDPGRLERIQNLRFSFFDPGIVVEFMEFHTFQNTAFGRTRTMPALLPWKMFQLPGLKKEAQEGAGVAVTSIVANRTRALRERIEALAPQFSIRGNDAPPALDVQAWLATQSDDDQRRMANPFLRQHANQCATQVFHHWVDLVRQQSKIDAVRALQQ